MKTTCLSCGSVYDHYKNDGLCPLCSAYNSAYTTKTDFDNITSGNAPVKLVFDNPTMAYAPNKAAGSNPNTTIKHSKAPIVFSVIFCVLAILVIGSVYTATIVLPSVFSDDLDFAKYPITIATGIDDEILKEKHIDILSVTEQEYAYTPSALKDFVPVAIEISTIGKYLPSDNIANYKFYINCNNEFFTQSEFENNAELVKNDKGFDNEYAFTFDSKDTIQLLFFIPDKDYENVTLYIDEIQSAPLFYTQISASRIEIPISIEKLSEITEVT